MAIVPQCTLPGDHCYTYTHHGISQVYFTDHSTVSVCKLLSLTATQLRGTHQARSQGGFEGVRTNPPCSLAKFILTRQQQYRVAIMQLLQGVVTYTSPVETFATGIKNFDR